ncbi:MAG TPA: GDSL-type esterase/lipase family protein [Sphingomonas sp.]|jgi:lysophospholipase L1-like esterase|uniref:GDSL-type esterase/lipase family protein n=1 Tax=Sphingomonas sp. TaxID=28214 RepID=UPI002EDBB70A
MTTRQALQRVAWLAWLAIGPAVAALPPAPGLAPTASIPPPVTPQDRLNQAWWAARHRALLATLAADPDPKVLLIGDSITNNYDKSDPPDEDFKPIWQAFYAPRGALNLGYSGDTTAHVLWRLRHGEIDGIHPKAAVLLIGTNDTQAGRSAIDTQRGIDAVVAELRNRLPDTKILLLGILPSGISEAKTATDRAVNRYLARHYVGHPRVTYRDIGGIFMKADGTLDPAVFYDPRLPHPGKPLHPDTVGQRRMAEAIEPLLVRLIGRLRDQSASNR